MAKIVVCEDDQTIQKLIRIALRTTPNEVFAASTGLEGLRLIERERPDLVLTDLFMPELDGFALVETLKGDPALAQIPVLVITASAQRQTIEEGRARGITDYLIKPFTAHELRDTVARLLSQSAAS